MRLVKNISRLFSAFAVVTVTTTQFALADEPIVKSGNDGITVEAQPLAGALQEFSDQSGLQIAYVATLAEDVSSKGTHEADTAAAALSEILDSTGLEYRFINDDTVAIGPGASSENEAEDLGNSRATPRAMMVRASVDVNEKTEEGAGNRQEGHSAETRYQGLPIEEIVVTGTNIRGALPVGAPVTVIDRADIVLSGAADIPQLIRRLPQNFGGGMTEQTSTGAGGNPSTTFSIGGTGVNLRGLGNDATLTLINGRRFAATGLGNFFDVTSIPLIAVDRVEILTDGASALYGADAVGGVVNIILQDDFQGAATTARYGTVTRGGLDEVQLGQTLGRRWNDGGLFTAFQYADRDALFADERAFARDADDPRSLLPEREKYAAFLNVDQALSKRTALSSSFFFSRRRSRAEQVSGGVTRATESASMQTSGNFGTSVDITDTWRATLDASFSHNETSTTIIAPTSTREFEIVSSGFVVDLKADGELFDLPGGAAKLALLGQFRSETFDDKTGFLSSGPAKLDRKIHAFSSELYLPLVTDANGRPGVERLEATLAGRIERYSDFGTSINPKIGLAYSPVEGFTLRSTFGTSFLAPQLFELNDLASFSFLLVGPDPLSDIGTSIFYQRSGNNSQLDAEEGTVWTVGFDYSPSFLKGLETSLTYFDIDFENRIVIPVGVFASAALTRPDLVPLVTRNPGPDLIAEIQAGRVFNFSGLPQDEAEAGVIAVLDSRLLNIASLNTDGFDFSLDYSFETRLGEMSAFATGTYLLNRQEQLLPELPVNETLNTKFNPIDLKLRGGVSLSTGGFTGGIFVNFQNSYEDPDTTPVSKTDSFTTVDLTLSYDFPDVGAFSNASVQANVLNVFNEDPPFVSSNSLGINYDGANGNPLGRFVSISLTTRW